MDSNKPFLEKNQPSVDGNQPRRIFLQRALTAAGLTLSASAISTILMSCETDESQPTPPVDPTGIKVAIADFPELTGPGTIITTSIDGLDFGVPVFISQVGDTTFAVFSTTCTHSGCPVSLPLASGEDCICSCHGSQFSSTTGAVTRGPAASNLRAFASTFNVTTGILTVQP